MVPLPLSSELLLLSGPDCLPDMTVLYNPDLTVLCASHTQDSQARNHAVVSAKDASRVSNPLHFRAKREPLSRF